MAALRAAMPESRDGWLTAAEFMILGCWFVWLAFATSLFAWVHFNTWRYFSLARAINACIVSVLGPSLFQWVSSKMMIGTMAFRFRWFDPLAYSISFGLIFTSAILAGLFYVFRLGDAKALGSGHIDNSEGTPFPES